MKKRILSLGLVSAMMASAMLSSAVLAEETVTVGTEQAEGYTYGEHFHSDEPVTYSMMFSDASWYPMVDTWKTEGIFAKITEYTNVTLDLTSIDSGDYDSKKALLINAGEAPYIIPKTYSEAAFVDGGAVVPVSDYTEYMPNYTAFVENYNFNPDLDTIRTANGKYYRLPGMNEAPLQDYTLIMRDDYFEGAGYSIADLEKDWTWEEFTAILKDVKAYMVGQGIITDSDYVWSDLWAGSEVDGSGGNILKLIGGTYGVPAGWAVGNGVAYDAESDQFYFAETSDNFKQYITTTSNLVKEGLLDPETFTQDNQTALNKFFRGETAVISVNRSQYTSYVANLDEQLGAGNYKLYYAVIPKGNCNYMAENVRLENGVMISENARKALSDDEFIKMMRFVDWLFYSDEAYDLTKWGVEGETYEVDENGIKHLLPGYSCSGLGIAKTNEDDVDIRLQWGYAGGNYFYGGTVEQLIDNFNEVVMDFVNRETAYRDVKPLDPAYTPDEDQNEQLNLWKTPLIDNVNTWSLQFITGVKDVEADWDAYVASCEGMNASSMIDLINEIYESGK